ncbi:MAG: 4-hydroxy-3-methylbut-2-enyl diphosphate reductase [Bacteroidaceae bacterium]|nr:4-hydroxy-3-methylbut-2-enyl diphosphate reductase [Bacteroidaceae bacterium]
MAQVEIDNNSGFCNGVVRAIQAAEHELEQGGELYCLGDIVHNSNEVERLRAKGLITINHDELRNLRNVKVLLRAHGEPPETYRIAQENNIEIIDATCPVVLQLQRKIKKSYDTRSSINDQILIYGKVGHAEVNGLVGQTDGEAIVLESPADLDKVDFDKRIVLYSQTTKSVQHFAEMVELIKERTEGERFEWHDTICRQVANRIPNIREFARTHDLVLFVCGKKSSNGKVLYEECRSVNQHTHLVSDIEELDASWLNGKSNIGICGATSTPRWLMLQFQARVEELLRDIL